MVLEISEQKGSFKISSLLQLELKLFLGLVTLPSLERLLPSDFVSELHSETPRNWRFVLLVLLGVERALSSRRDDSFLFKSAHLKEKKNPKQTKDQEEEEREALSSCNTKLIFNFAVEKILESISHRQLWVNKPGILFHCLRGSESKAGWQQTLSIQGSPSYWSKQSWWD